MKGQEHEREHPHHQQLHVRRPRGDIRREGEPCRGDDRADPGAGQTAHERPHRHERQDQNQKDRDVVGRERISRDGVDRRRQRAGDEVRFGIGERAGVRVEDIGVEDIPRVVHQRMRDPRDVPHAELSVIRIHTGDRAGPGDGRIAQDRGERGAGGEGDDKLAPRRTRHHSKTIGFTSTPRNRVSLAGLGGGVNPLLLEIEITHTRAGAERSFLYGNPSGRLKASLLRHTGLEVHRLRAPADGGEEPTRRRDGHRRRCRHRTCLEDDLKPAARAIGLDQELGARLAPCPERHPIGFSQVRIVIEVIHLEHLDVAGARVAILEAHARMFGVDRQIIHVGQLDRQRSLKARHRIPSGPRRRVERVHDHLRREESADHGWDQRQDYRSNRRKQEYARAIRAHEVAIRHRPAAAEVGVRPENQLDPDVRQHAAKHEPLPRRPTATRQQKRNRCKDEREVVRQQAGIPSDHEVDDVRAQVRPEHFRIEQDV